MGIENAFHACGAALVLKSQRTGSGVVYFCPRCQVIVPTDEIDPNLLKESEKIPHSPREETLVLTESDPPPIPILSSLGKQIRCKHKKAVFQGSYQFARGDESSRSYWYCPDCGRVFRFGGRFRFGQENEPIDRK